MSSLRNIKAAQGENRGRTPGRRPNARPRAERLTSRRPGFTLVELLVTIVVLAFGCLAAVKMQGDALRGGALADHLTVAALLAESEMERLKSLTRSQLDAEVAAGDKEEPQLNRLGEACPDPPDCPGYIYGRRVRFFAGMPTTFSHQAEITVSWNEAAGAKSVLYSGVMTPLSF